MQQATLDIQCVTMLSKILIVLVLFFVACDEVKLPKGQIDFVERIETCPLESYGSKKFCSIRTDHKCHKICIENPSCCDLTMKLEKN